MPDTASTPAVQPALTVVMLPGVAPPGWSAFDPKRIDELRVSAGSADAPCPFEGHDGHRLPWRSGGYRKGTAFHGDPPVSFRVSPTYVLADKRDNFIVGRQLLGQLAGKAETWRLGNENSSPGDLSWDAGARTSAGVGP